MCKNEGETTALTPEQKLYQERLNRVETAIHLGTPDKVPVFAFFSSYIICREPMVPVMQISITILTKPGRRQCSFIRTILSWISAYTLDLPAEKPTRSQVPL